MEKIYFWSHCCPFARVRVVILGQDPYHRAGQATGMAFSVPEGCKIPPSLRNIFKEMKRDLGCEMPRHGCLLKWAEQGVLLLNTTLTVREGCPGSHSKCGWGVFVDCVISEISRKRDRAVFMLWGKHSEKKEKLIDGEKHLVLKAPHPSPLSVGRGFLGCGHFSKANDFLGEIGWSRR
ncbi:MAG: uracil-dna glycosylase [Amphiamblys sp. WSBS2006]|nr:MAG: uracil-dna glycosylase [Amphiamblys sp. WSBS2006]